MPRPVLHAFSSERGIYEESTFWNPSWTIAPGAVLTSNVCDMARSAEAIGSGELISRRAYRTLLDPGTVGKGGPIETCPATVCRAQTEESHYGLGMVVRNGWVFQNPLFSGYGEVMASSPRRAWRSRWRRPSAPHRPRATPRRRSRLVSRPFWRRTIPCSAEGAPRLHRAQRTSGQCGNDLRQLEKPSPEPWLEDGTEAKPGMFLSNTKSRRAKLFRTSHRSSPNFTLARGCPGAPRSAAASLDDRTAIRHACGRLWIASRHAYADGSGGGLGVSDPSRKVAVRVDPGGMRNVCHPNGRHAVRLRRGRRRVRPCPQYERYPLLSCCPAP